MWSGTPFKRRPRIGKIMKFRGCLEGRSGFFGKGREKVRAVEHVAGSVRSRDDATRKGVLEVLEAFPRAVSSRESG